MKLNGKWGYAGRDGTIRIEPQFDSAQFFAEGRAIVCVGRCQTVEEKRDNFGSVHRWEGKFGVVDEQGKYIANPQFDSLLSFSEGLAPACIGSGCRGFTIGVDDQLDERWGFIDLKGELVIPYQFGSVQNFQEGLAAVCLTECDTNSRWGFIDATGKVVISPQFDLVEGFWDGIAQVWIGKAPDQRTGYIDRLGKYIVNPY